MSQKVLVESSVQEAEFPWLWFVLGLSVLLLGGLAARQYREWRAFGDCVRAASDPNFVSFLGEGREQPYIERTLERYNSEGFLRFDSRLAGSFRSEVRSWYSLAVARRDGTVVSRLGPVNEYNDAIRRVISECEDP